jgi:hypothetical protein
VLKRKKVKLKKAINEKQKAVSKENVGEETVSKSVAA